MVLFGDNSMFPRNFEFSDQGKALIEGSQEDAGRTKTRIVKQETYTLIGDGSGYSPNSGKVWFLTNISISSYNNNGTASAGYVKVSGSTFFRLECAPTSSLSGSLNFPFPIKVTSSDTILAGNGSSNVTTHVTFIGWEEDV